MTKDEIFVRLRAILAEMFELDEAIITPEAQLYDDLDIDSIDAVDLTVRLKNLTGKKIDPEIYKQIRTVRDIVDALADLMA
jgi:acyl carrier protein